MPRIMPLLVALALAVASLVSTHGPTQAQGSDSEVAQLRKRVEQLEGQMIDLQVVIGTLESLAQAPRRASGYGAVSAGAPADNGRIAALETQIRALTAQVEQLSSGRSAPLTTRSVVPRGSIPAGEPSGVTPSFGFGQTTVTPNSGPSRATGSDPIGGLIANNDTSGTSYAAPGFSSGRDSPKAEYDSAYGALLQQNYAAAQEGFESFLQANPRHELAGHAQYWLGEVYYVRGNYKAAASAFLKGYQTYSRSPKAPDSLLKLAMSLDRLGARDDACASLAAIAERFPDAPGHVSNRAQSEKRRMGC